MSEDALYALRDQGTWRWYWSRWGGLSIDTDLLRGPTAFRGYLAHQHATDEPFVEPWLCGYVVVDSDARAVLFWQSQDLAAHPAGRRLQLGLVRHRWPGWTVRKADLPMLDLGDALGLTLEAAVRTACDRAVPRTLDHLAEQDGRAWREHLAEPCPYVEHMEQELGTRLARLQLLETDHHVWVSLLTPDGPRDWLLDAGWPDHAALLVGDRLVDYLPTRPGGTLDELRVERAVTCLLIDPSHRRLGWWLAEPGWQLPVGTIEGLWPGWTLEFMPEGPEEQARRTGRDPEIVREPVEVVGERLRKMVARWVGTRPDGSAVMADAVARARTELKPGEELVVAPFDTTAPAAPDDWRSDVLCRAEELLAAPRDSQPPPTGD